MFNAQETKVFRYFDGSQEICSDPMAVYEDMIHLLDGDPDKYLEERWAGFPEEGELDPSGKPAEIDMTKEPIRYAARVRLEAAVRLAFPMAPFDRTTGKGATRDQCFAALDKFLAFLAEQKKSADGSLTAPAASEDFSQPLGAQSITSQPSVYG